MVSRRRINDVALIILLVGVPLVFLQANLKSPTSTNAVDRLLLRISAPVQAAVMAVASATHRTWRRYVYLVGARDETDALREQNAQLRRDLSEARRRLRTLSEYRRLLAFRAEQGVQTVGAQVIGRPASPFNRAVRVRIDRGDQMVNTGLPVVTADGVVGRVGSVYGRYADVQLAVDPKSSIDVLVRRTGGRGLLRGIDGTNRYLCRLAYLLRDQEVKVGDVVVTSGAAGVFPADLPIGRVSAVTESNYGLYQRVEVMPNVDFANVKNVLVVLAPPPPPAAREGSGTTPARGLTP